MEIADNLHLTYCSNIHPGETWDQVFATLKKNIPEIKRNSSPGKKFGIGLRLSADAAKTVLTGDHLSKFKNWLGENDCYVFTMNGFPYGNFHHTIVKDEVYQPDWTSDDRLNYTLDLIKILAELMPENSEAGISTSPISYKPWIKDHLHLEKILNAACLNLNKCIEELMSIHKETGKLIHIDIEPEPDCLLENSNETVFFFTGHLIPFAIAHLVNEFGIAKDVAERSILDHIRVCYDVCHFAVEFQDQQNSIVQLTEAGVRIGKVQISSALKVLTGGSTDRKKILEQYAAFAESTYLHQTIAKNKNGEMEHFKDLPEALKEFHNQDLVEWRTHYHVPVFMSSYNKLQSTQEDVLKVLELLKRNKFTNHLEVETYTWEVLPQGERLSMNESIVRELNWVKGKLE